MIQWVQDEPLPDTPEDREYREAEQERARQVEECRDGNGHSWWLELEHPDDGAGVDLSCEHCPAGIDDLYPDGIDLIGGDLDGVTVDAGKHNSPVPLLIPVDCEVLTTRISNPIVGEDWDVEFTVAPRGPARPVQWPPDQTTAATGARPGCASCFCRRAGCPNEEQHHHLAAHGDYLKRKAGVRQNPPDPDPMEASLDASEELRS